MDEGRSAAKAIVMAYEEQVDRLKVQIEIFILVFYDLRVCDFSKQCSSDPGRIQGEGAF